MSTALDRKIIFHNADLEFTLPKKGLHRVWLATVTSEYGYRIKDLQYIFCSDNYLHEMNVQYLDHDTLTDIITFDYNEEAGKGHIMGELYISLDRVKDNAQDNGENWERELARVMVHGVLHLCGLKDKSETDAAIMRKAEEQALALWEQQVAGFR